MLKPRKSVLKIFPILLSAFAVFCIARPALAADEAQIDEKFSPLKLADGVIGATSAVAWSPDGKRIAYLTQNALMLHDTETGKTTKSSFTEPAFVNWTDEEAIYVIHKKDGTKKVLIRVEPLRLKKKEVKLGVEPDAVFPVSGKNGGLLIVLSTRAKVLKIGTKLDYHLYIFDQGSGQMDEIFMLGRIVPVRSAAIDYTSGWLRPGPSPTDTVTIGMEHINPPALKPYLRVISIDHLTGKGEELARIPHRGFSTPGTWSPDGRRIAMANQSGRLLVLGTDGNFRTVNDEVQGRAPSWNPKGSQIYFGGRLIDSNGAVRETVLAGGDAPMSSAFWSPDGTKMAVKTGDGSLWLLGSGFSPQYVHPDTAPPPGLKEKIMTLKELFNEGLIDSGEYHERRNSLTRGGSK